MVAEAIPPMHAHVSARLAARGAADPALAEHARRHWPTIRGAARIHRISPSTLERWIARGQVTAVLARKPEGMPGGQPLLYYVHPEQTAAMMATHRPAPNVPTGTPLLLTPDRITRHPKRAQLIARVVANTYEMPLEAILGPGRVPEHVEARRVLIVLLLAMPEIWSAHGWPTAEEQGWGITGVGRLLGRDHSTCLHHLGRITTRPTYEESAMLAECRAALSRVLVDMASRRKSRPAPAQGQAPGGRSS